MSQSLNVITGATGQLGSHIAEQLRQQDQAVRVLVRPGSDETFLRSIGAEIVFGDLKDADAVQRAFAGARIVYHSAAKVSDWGAWEAFKEEAETTTRNVVRAATAANIERLLHVSSISVYGHPKEAPVVEETPLGQKIWMWDYYPMAKLLAENLAREFPRTTVVRPSWLYGERDRITMPRVIPALLEKRVPIIGSGDNYLNIIYAGDVARGCILAANHPGALGQAYNLCSEGEVTQRDMLNALTDALSLPRVTKKVPYFLAIRFAFVKEAIARLFRRTKPPTITRRAVYLVGRSTQYSIAKARRELGWSPRMPIRDGIQRAVQWYRASTGGVMKDVKL